MKFELKHGDISTIKCDAIIVNLFEEAGKTGDAIDTVDAAMGGAISDIITAGEIKGKLNETHVIHSLGKIPSRMILILGLGKKQDLNTDKVRNLMGEAIRVLKKHNCKSVATILHGAKVGGISPQESAQAIVEGCMLGAYQFKKHLTQDNEEHDIEDVLILQEDEALHDSIKKSIEKGKIIAEATILARNMVNEPANHMTPSHMAQIAREIANKNGLDVTIMDRERIEEEGMGALLGVAQGTKQPPKFIIMSYRGDSSKPDTIGFIGKGLTFDSGGISLKPQDFMSDMKGDMSGGAVVIAAISAIAELKLKINITAIIPCTENLPSGRALKPGDILKASNGKTIEVVNTDAEGRLILADALSYAVKHEISAIVDLATLTGACHIALGDLYAGVFTNKQSLADKVIKAADAAGENLWQLPLPDEYKDLNKSDVADIKNSGGRYGGAITAALFLKEFVGDIPWVHIDIAGPFMSEKAKGILTKGATGFGVRTLIKLASDWH